MARRDGLSVYAEFHRADEDDLPQIMGKRRPPPQPSVPALHEIVFRNSSSVDAEKHALLKEAREKSGKEGLVDRIPTRFSSPLEYLLACQCHEAVEYRKIADVQLRELRLGHNTQPGEDRAFVEFEVVDARQGNEDFEVDVRCTETDPRVLDKLRRDNEVRVEEAFVHDFGDGAVEDENTRSPWWFCWLLEVKRHPEIVLCTGGSWESRTLTLYFLSGRPAALKPKTPLTLRPVDFVKPSLQHFYFTHCLREALLAGSLEAPTLDLLKQIADPHIGPGEYAQAQGFKLAPTSAAPGSFDEIIANLKPGLSAIQGPPGTGKSTAIKNINRDRVPDGTKTLVTCTKNKAVDAVAEKMKDEPGGVVVYGNRTRLGPTALAQRPNIRAQKHKETRLWMQVSDQLDALELTLQAGSAHALDWVHSGVGAGIGLEGDAKNSLLAQLFGQHFWALMKKVSTLRTPFYSMKWRSKLLNTNSSSPPWHPAYNRLTLLLRMGACRIIALKRLGLLDAYMSQPPPAPAAQSATQAGLPGAHSQLAGCAGYGAPGSAGGEGHVNGRGAEEDVVVEQVQQESAEPLLVTVEGGVPVWQGHPFQHASSNNSSSGSSTSAGGAVSGSHAAPMSGGGSWCQSSQSINAFPSTSGGSSCSSGSSDRSAAWEETLGESSVGWDNDSEATASTREILSDGPGIGYDECVPWELGWASPVAALFNLRSALMLLYDHRDEPDSPDKRAADALVQEALTYLSTLTASPLRLRAAAVVQKIKLESLGEYAGHLARQVVDVVLGNVRRSVEVDILRRASTILCTIDSVPAMHFKVSRTDPEMLKQVKTAVVDEAGCVPEYEVPLLLSFFPLVNLVLIGDHKQLPSFSKIDRNEQMSNRRLHNHSRSLLQRIGQGNVPIPVLTTQWRMAHPICDVVSSEFYSGQLVTGPTVPRRSIWQTLRWAEVTEGYPPNFRSERGERYEGNPFEARRAVHEAILAYRRMQAEGIEQPSVVIIAPYNRHVALLEAELQLQLMSWRKAILALTVDKAQGSEADAVVLSLVKTEGGYAEDERRMCVALSRARRFSVLVGNSAMRNANPKWGRIIDAYQGTWRYPSCVSSTGGAHGCGQGVVGAHSSEPSQGPSRQRRSGVGMPHSSSTMSVGGGSAQQPRSSASGGAAAAPAGQCPHSCSVSSALQLPVPIPIPVPVPEPVPAASTVTTPTATAAGHSAASILGACNSSEQLSSHSAVAPPPIDTRDLMESFGVDPGSPDAHEQVGRMLSELMV